MSVREAVAISSKVTASRRCACGCGASLADLRSDAVYASESCSKRARRADSPDKGRTRRPSRNGKGAHVYVSAEEIEVLDWLLADTAFKFKAGDSLKHKLKLAADRIQAAA